MKRYKRIVFWGMAVLYVCSLAFGVGAFYNESGSELEPQYIVSCPNGGKHFMIPIGQGRIYGRDADGDRITLLEFVSGYQCEYCCLKLVTENNVVLFPYDPWGRYCTESCNDMYVSGLADVVIQTNFSSIDQLPVSTSRTDPYVMGFEFGTYGIGISLDE